MTLMLNHTEKDFTEIQWIFIVWYSFGMSIVNPPILKKKTGKNYFDNFDDL